MEMLTKSNYRSLLLQAYEDIMTGKRSRVSFNTKYFIHIVSLTKKGHGVHLFIQPEGTIKGAIEFTTMVYHLPEMKDYLDEFIISYTWRQMLED